MPERSARTVLAFDFGLKRIGVAVGEPELRSAHPLPAISAPGFDSIGRLVAEWRPAQLVVGLPLHADGTPHAMTAQAQRFARALETRFGRPVALMDERWTSQVAEHALHAAGHGGRAGRARRDETAAQLILQSWFDETQ